MADRTGSSAGLGIDVLDKGLDGVDVRTVFGSKRNIELACDNSSERNEIERGHAEIQEADIQVLLKRDRLPVYFEVVRDKLSDTFFRRRHGYDPFSEVDVCDGKQI